MYIIKQELETIAEGLAWTHHVLSRIYELYWNKEHISPEVVVIERLRIEKYISLINELLAQINAQQNKENLEIHETIIVFTECSQELIPHSLWTNADDAEKQIAVFKNYGYTPVKYRLPIVLPETLNGSYLR